MNSILYKSALAMISLALITSTSLAQAATYRLNFDKIVAYDDGDYKPDGAGEITFEFAVNSERIFKKYMVLDDRGKDTFNLDLSKDITVPDNQVVTITAKGNEYDKHSRNEMCAGTEVISPTNTGGKKLDCGEGNGELGIYLYFNATKLD